MISRLSPKLSSRILCSPYRTSHIAGQVAGKAGESTSAFQCANSLLTVILCHRIPRPIAIADGPQTTWLASHHAPTGLASYPSHIATSVLIPPALLLTILVKSLLRGPLQIPLQGPHLGCGSCQRWDTIHSLFRPADPGVGRPLSLAFLDEGDFESSSRRLSITALSKRRSLSQSS